MGAFYSEAGRSAGVFAADAEPGHLGSTRARDGAEICFESWGDGDTALVFVHGGLCDRSFWFEQIGPFSSGHRVVALDLPGHGDSGKTRTEWSAELLGDDVCRVVQALDTGRVILVGHSAGAPVVVEAARQLGSVVLGVVVVDFFHALGAGPPRRPGAGGDMKEAMRQGMFTPDADLALREKIIEAMTSAPPEVAAGLQRAVSAFDVGAGLKAIAAMPISLVLSDLRPIEPAALRSLHPEVRVCAVRNVGHFLMLEAPHTFNAVLRTEVLLMTHQVKSF